MPTYESSMRNLAKARERWRPPRPWRSKEESEMVRRFAFLWFTGCGQKPSGRAWARELGISHTWLQKLIRRFQADPGHMHLDARRRGDPDFAQLIRARDRTQQMRERGELRELSYRKVTGTV